jgi:hypothetical protein
VLFQESNFYPTPLKLSFFYRPSISAEEVEAASRESNTSSSTNKPSAETSTGVSSSQTSAQNLSEATAQGPILPVSAAALTVNESQESSLQAITAVLSVNTVRSAIPIDESPNLAMLSIASFSSIESFHQLTLSAAGSNTPVRTAVPVSAPSNSALQLSNASPNPASGDQKAAQRADRALLTNAIIANTLERSEPLFRDKTPSTSQPLPLPWPVGSFPTNTPNFLTYRSVSDPTKRSSARNPASQGPPPIVQHGVKSNLTRPGEEDVITIPSDEIEVVYVSGQATAQQDDDDDVIVISDSGPSGSVYRGSGAAMPSEAPDKIWSGWRDSLALVGRTLQRSGSQNNRNPTTGELR